MHNSRQKRVACIIPARYASTRLPGKPLIMIDGVTLIMRVHDRVAGSKAFDDVIVATDDRRIFNTVLSGGGRAVMTSEKHASGTDRVFEAVRNMACDYIVNVQGDEPDIPLRLLKDFASEVRTLDDNTLLTCATNATIKEIQNPNAVKVVRAANGDALYFSRCAIPYYRNSGKRSYFRHIGIYGYTRMGIRRFCSLPQGILEKAESLEQLRALEGGMRIRCLVRQYHGTGIDTPQDLENFRKMLAKQKKRG
jgi:3-deoxy-manno-octulosonate cytidylyltransferase (CMP-KDO synthetase)